MLMNYFIVLVLIIGSVYSFYLPENMEKMEPSKRDVVSMDGVSMVAAMFQLGDQDKDGKMSKVEIYEYFKSVTNSFSAYIRSERFMTAGDRDGDGFLNYTEALAASSAIKK